MARHHRFLFILLLLQINICRTDSAPQQQVAGHEKCEVNQLHRMLEETLTDDPVSLNKLREAFFPVGMATGDRLDFRLCINMSMLVIVNFPQEQRLNFNAKSLQFQDVCWDFSWSNSLLYGAVTSQLFALDYTYSFLTYEMAHRDYNSMFSKPREPDPRNRDLKLYMRGSSTCNTIDPSAIDTAVIDLAAWVRWLYASYLICPDFCTQKYC